MISSAGEYKYVTGLDGLKIDGGIMPLRADPREVRGEDIAFLGEASHELYLLARRSDPPAISMEDRRLLADRVASVTYGGAARVVTNYWSERTTPYAKPDDFVPIKDFIEIEKTEPGDELKMATIADTFTNTNRIRSCISIFTIESTTFSGIAHSFDRGVLPGGEGDQEQVQYIKDGWDDDPMNGLVLRAETSKMVSFSDVTGNNYWRCSRATGGTVSFRYSGIPSVAAAAWAFLPVEVHWPDNQVKLWTGTYISGSVATFSLTDILALGLTVAPAIPTANDYCTIHWDSPYRVQLFRGDHTLYSS